MIITLDHIETGLELEIRSAGKSSTDPVIKTDAEQFGESPYQINEGHFYYYQFSDEQYHFNSDQIIECSPFSKHEGRISPNIYVGTLKLYVHKNDVSLDESINIEVRSVKTSYRQDYRHMLEEITEKCTELLMQVNASVYQS